MALKTQTRTVIGQSKTGKLKLGITLVYYGKQVNVEAILLVAHVISPESSKFI